MSDERVGREASQGLGWAEVVAVGRDGLWRGMEAMPMVVGAVLSGLLVVGVMLTGVLACLQLVAWVWA